MRFLKTRIRAVEQERNWLMKMIKDFFKKIHNLRVWIINEWEQW